MNKQSLSSWPSTLSLIFLLALAIRIVFILTLKDGFYFADEFTYTTTASYIVEHGKFPADFDRAPLYPLFVAIVYGTIGDELLHMRIVQSVLGGIIAVVIALIGRRIGGYAVGAVAGVLWAIYPMGAFISGTVYPAALLTLLMAAGVLCLLTKPDAARYTARVGLAGLLFGAATLTKPIAFATIVLVTFWIVIHKRPGRILLVSVFLLSAFTALLPWTVYNASLHGRLVPIESRSLDSVVPWAKSAANARKIDQSAAAQKNTAKPATVATVQKEEDKPTAVLKKESKPTAAQSQKAQPIATQKKNDNEVLGMLIRMAKRYPNEFLHFFELYPQRVGYLIPSERDRARRTVSPRFVRNIPFGSDLVMTVSIVSVGGLYLAALIGIGAMWYRRDKRRELFLLFLLVMSFALGYAISWGKIRYRIPVDPYIIILSAWGIVFAWNRVFKNQPKTEPKQSSA
jgi:4-amino-4-deoxy-L-arabinose transferase-like glycosyltransferase